MRKTSMSFKWCHPGDGGKRWVLMFDDADMGISIYYDEAEAMDAWKKANAHWNCHLFVSAPRPIQFLDISNGTQGDVNGRLQGIESHPSRDGETFSRRVFDETL